MDTYIDTDIPEFTKYKVVIQIDSQYDIDCLVWTLRRGLKEIKETSIMKTDKLEERITGVLKQIEHKSKEIC